MRAVLKQARVPLMAAVVGMIGPCLLSAQEMNETFDDNQREWTTRSDAPYYSAVRNGVYEMELAQNVAGFMSGQSVEPGQRNAFALSVRLRFLKGLGYWAGLYWGADPTNRYYFVIAPGGAPDSEFPGDAMTGGLYEIYRSVNSYDPQYAMEFASMVQRTPSPAIRGLGEWNELYVTLEDERLMIAINDAPIVSFKPIQPMDISSVGVLISGMLKAEFDDFHFQTTAGSLGHGVSVPLIPPELLDLRITDVPLPRREP